MADTLIQPVAPNEALAPVQNKQYLPGAPVQYGTGIPDSVVPAPKYGKLADFIVPESTSKLSDVLLNQRDLRGIGEANARLNQEDYSVKEVLNAATESWLLPSLERSINKYLFNREYGEDDPTFSPYDFLKGANKGLSEQEMEYFLDNANNPRTAARAMRRINEMREVSKVTGDNRVASVIIGFADPLMLALPGAYGVSAGGTLSRAATVALSAGTNVALGRAGDDVYTTQDMLKDAFIGGALGAIFHTRRVALPIPIQNIGKPGVGVETAVDKSLGGGTRAITNAVGRGIQWNLHRTMSGYGTRGKHVAGELLDDVGDYSKVSVESYKESNLALLNESRFAVEDSIRAELGRRGHSSMSQITSPNKYHTAQMSLEKEILKELQNREAALMGLPTPHAPGTKEVQAIADRIGEFNKSAAGLMRRAGVEGAEELVGTAGYFHRRWDVAKVENIKSQLIRNGMSELDARKAIEDTLSGSLQSGSGISKDVADTIANTLLRRIEQQGSFNDATLLTAIERADAQAIKETLVSLHVSKADAEKIAQKITAGMDEAKKAGHLKQRMDMDYSFKLRMPDGTTRGIDDMIDHRVTSVLDVYAKRVAADSAFAQKGYKNDTAIQQLRRDFLDNVEYERRAEAEHLWSNTVAALRGEAVGATLDPKWRVVQGLTRTIALPNSGIWQLTEYAQIMAEYGLLKTTKEFMKNLPGFRSIARPNKGTARQLNTVLADHSAQSVRMRPFLMRYEDGFDMGVASGTELFTQAAGNAIPYANGMKWIHHHQANMVGNLILTRLDDAVRGNAKAIRYLAKDGIDVGDIKALKSEVDRVGFDVDKWSPELWDKVRPKLDRMVDAVALRSRMGDLPAFMTFDQLGKFLGAFRTFTFTAHNKLLAGGMMRNGAGAVGLLLMYQFPLAYAAVQAQAVLHGKGFLSDNEAAHKGVAVMGGIGLFSDVFKVASGDSNNIGTPGMLALDRTTAFAGHALRGDAAGAAKDAMGMIPLVSSIPFMRGITNTTFD